MTVQYDRADHDAGRSQPGTKAIMGWALDTFHPEASNLGIYVSRPVRGKTTGFSVHAEGRAGDTAFNPHPKFAPHPRGQVLADILVAHSDPLGIQLVIHNNREWSSRRQKWSVHCGHPGVTGPHGTCSGPHYDHVHWEQNRDGAARVTRAFIDATITSEDDMPWTDEDRADQKAIRAALESINHHIAGDPDKGARLPRLLRFVEAIKTKIVE